jgi:Tol biopolymer transport system component
MAPAVLAACSQGAGGVGGVGGAGGSAPPNGGGNAQLVFASDGNILVMAADGSGKASLTKVPQGALAKDPAWAPDGARIAYAYTPPLPAVRGPGGLLPLPVTGIYVMAADGSGQTVSIPHDRPGIGHENPVWATDGKSFYVTYTELIMETNVVKDQVVEVARVTPGQAQRQTLIPNGAFPTLSADGRQLACIVTSRDGQALVVATADGKNVRALIPPGQLDGLSSPRVSPDGKQIAYAAAAPATAAPAPTPAPTRAAAGGLGSLFAPRAAQAHGLPMDLFVIPVDGGAPRRLTQLFEDNPAPAWSPDGAQIAILAGGGVHRLRLATSELALLDSKGGHGSIDWRST